MFQGDPQKARRITSVVMGLMCELAAGTLYAYGLYEPKFSNDPDAVMGYTHAETNLIGSFGHWGLYLAAPVGWFFDRYGPERTIGLGSIVIFLGYLFMSLIVRAVLNGGTAPSPILLALAYFLVGQGSGAAYSSATLTNTRNFPSRHRGKVLGLLVSTFGLSAAFFSVIYKSAFDENAKLPGFLLFLAIFCASVNVAGAFLVHNIPVHESSPDASTKDEAEIGDITGLDLFRNKVFLMTWYAMFVGTGTGLMYIVNVGSLSAALGGDESIKNSMVILLSVFNCIGRLTMGYLSDRFLAKYDRVFFVAVALGVLATGSVLIQLATLGAFYLTTALMGFGYGGLFALFPVIVADLFGMKSYGQNWGWLLSAAAIGSLIFGLLFGEIYDIEKHGRRECGHECFYITFIIVFMLLMSGIAVCRALINERKARRSAGYASLNNDAAET